MRVSSKGLRSGKPFCGISVHGGSGEGEKEREKKREIGGRKQIEYVESIANIT
jgi:hypothetical protein